MPDQAGRFEPSNSGHIDVGDGHRVYWETWGNPDGKPALFLHGGPGSGCRDTARSCFEPDVYRVVQFDQRGCGKSTPHASEPDVDLFNNTTDDLLSDIERLREHLGIAQWLVLGGSWGSTLALAYAERHPAHIKGMVLFSVTTSSPAEIDWISHGIGRFFPEAYARFCEASGAVEGANLLDAYHGLLMHPDPAIHEKAASDWCAWEAAIVALHANDKPSPRYLDPAFRLAFARLVTHYWRHNVWLEDGALLRNIRQLAGIPAIMLHGRLDIGSPLMTPWRLQQHWPGSELIIIDDAGHGAGHAGMRDGIIAATTRLAT